MTDVFDPASDDNSVPTSTETPASLFEQLVGEGKKYKTAEDLARSRLEADNFIEQLKDEKKGVLEDLQAKEKTAENSKTIEDLMQLVTKATSTTEEGNRPEVSKEELVKLIDNRLTETKQSEVKQRNREESNQAILNKFEGDAGKAREFVQARARELSMSTEALAGMAETSPAAFKQLLSLDTHNATPGSTSVSSFANVNTQSANVGNPTVKNATYYRNLRKELGSKFWAPDIQQELIRNREQMGADKFNGN